MRGIVIGGMVIGLLMGCNNGMAELEKNNKFLSSLANLGKGFLSVFTDLEDMATGVFGINAETKKSDIEKYFTAIETTMNKVKEKLNTVVGENGNYAKVKEKVASFITTIDKIAEGAKIAAGGSSGGGTIGNAVQSEAANPEDFNSVNFIVNGIKKIVEVVVLKEGSADANKTASTDQESIGKLLSGTTSDATEAVLAAASASIGAVSGADILRAIASSDVAADNNVAINLAKNAAEIAAAAKSTNNLKTGQKDAVIAGGIALRAMAKDGKFAAHSNVKYVNAVNGVAASAVNKTLSVLIIAVRNTVDSGLKKINEVLAAVNQGDMSAETSESGVTK